MRNSVNKTKVIFASMTTALVAAAALWLSMRAVSSEDAESGFSKDMNSRTDVSGAVASKQMAEPRDYSHSPSRHQSKSEKLVGTWKKQRTCAIDQVLQNFNDNDWHLTVRFTQGGRFIWDSRRTGSEGSRINDSLTGKYSIEDGFLINYRFDKPSPEALERLPMLFAFWPNQLLGRHTFRFEEDCLVLGHDGEKIWLYLKRNSLQSD